MQSPISPELAKKYLAGTCTPEEVDIIHDWYSSFDDISEDMAGLPGVQQKILEDKLLLSILTHIKENDAPETVPDDTVSSRSGWKHWFKGSFQLKIAAFFIFAVLLTFIVYNKKSVYHSPAPVTAKNKAANVNDFLPGGNKAVLTLADGSKIVLDSASNGLLVKKGDITIKKAKNGQLVYAVVPNTKLKAEINTLETPVGGQYEVFLPDGTHAWLNSKSWLKFPTSFEGRERNVEISGEVYFEVAKNKSKPFIVHSDLTRIEVLGTHFNVMAYPNEKIQTTTLLEGSIRISNDQVTHLLKPGEQAAVYKGSQMEVTGNVNVAEVVAWKNGFFEFNNTDIQMIMREVSRWYGVNVIYKDPDMHTRYTGRISREVNLSELLSMLKYTGLVYQLNGLNLTITE